MKKIIPALAVCLLLLLAGCGGPGTAVSTPPEQTFTDGSEPAGTTNEYNDDGTKNYTTVKAAADEPVAGAQAESYYWGYINTKGEWVIAPKYTKVYPFVDNVATVQLESGEWQLINKSNEVLATFEKGIEVVEPLHPRTYPLPDQPESSGCTIFEGMIIIARDGNGDGIITPGTGKDFFGYADTAGKITVEPKYRGANAFGDGLAAVNFAQTEDENNWGFIDKTGKTVIEPRYKWAGVFSEGLCRASTEGQPGQGGCIDKQGNFVISHNSYIYPNGDFKNGTAPAKLRSEFGIIDKNGDTVATVPGSNNKRYVTNYSPIAADAFQDGLYPLFDISLPGTEDGFGPQGFIDTTGNFAIPAQTEWKVCQGFSDGMCCVYKGKSNFDMNKTYGYIDKTGKVVIPIEYYKANMFSFGYAAVAKGDIANIQYTIIDKTGRTVAELKDVTDALPFTK